MIRRELLQRLGVRAVSMIEENIRSGRSYDGRAYSYSTRPFARPIGGLKNMRALAREGRIKPFTTKSGRLWAVITGGYRDWRAMNGMNPDGDFLQATGAMLRGLNVVGVDDTTVTLGWTDAKDRAKAMYLDQLGAGKSRRLWPFLGFTKEQQEELGQYAGGLLTTDDILAMVRSEYKR